MNRLEQDSSENAAHFERLLEISHAGETEREILKRSVRRIIAAKDAEIAHWKKRVRSHGCDVDNGDPDCG